jgi:hypothetical protein
MFGQCFGMFGFGRAHWAQVPHCQNIFEKSSILENFLKKTAYNQNIFERKN